MDENNNLNQLNTENSTIQSETNYNQNPNTQSTDIEQVNQTPEYISPVVEEENIRMGIIGAILGSLVGAIVIIIIGKLGYVAAISGVVMAYLTIMLYEKFAKKISKKGLIICIVIMVIMTLLAENMSFAMDVAKELKEMGYNPSTMKIFINLYSIMREGLLNTSNYFINLLLVYAFAALGAFRIVVQKRKTLQPQE